MIARQKAMAHWPRDIPPLPLPLQGMKAEEDITHAPKGYTPSGRKKESSSLLSPST
jgi:hypothetical protein